MAAAKTSRENSQLQPLSYIYIYTPLLTYTSFDIKFEVKICCPQPYERTMCHAYIDHGKKATNLFYSKTTLNNLNVNEQISVPFAVSLPCVIIRYFSSF